MTLMLHVILTICLHTFRADFKRTQEAGQTLEQSGAPLETV